MSAPLLDTSPSKPFGSLLYKLKEIFSKPKCNIVLQGPPGSGKRTAIQAAADFKGIAVTNVDLDAGREDAAIKILKKYLGARALGQDGKQSNQLFVVSGFNCLPRVPIKH